MGHVAVRQELRGGGRHLPAQLGEVIVRQPAVEDAARILHQAMADEVDDRPAPRSAPGVVGRGLRAQRTSPSARAAAAAAAGRADTILSITPSSCVADKNQASY